MKKKFLLALLLALVFTCIFAISVSAATTQTIDGIVYSVDTANKTATITTANRSTTITDVVIPTTVTVDGVECAVNINREAFKGNKNIITVTINGQVTAADRVFESMPNLETVVIKEGATSISQYMFASSKKLTSVTLPSTLTTIYNDAFRSCTALSSIDLKNVVEIQATAFYETTSLTSVTIPNTVTTIGRYAFQKSGLTSVTIPTSMTAINEGVFDGCASLKTVEIPNTVTSMGMYVFRNSGLTSVTIPDSITSIGDQAFYGCTSLTSVVIPDTMTTFGQQCFRGCTTLGSIYLPKGFKSYGSGALAGCTSLTTVTVNEENTYFVFDATAKILLSTNGKTLYQYLDSNTATTYTIPSTITTISKRAFCAENSLKTVIIPSTVISMDQNVFEGCTALETFEWPSHITSIPNQTFLDCVNLTNFTMPSTVTTVYDEAFRNCQKLVSTNIDFSKLTTIKGSAFYGCSSLTGDLNFASLTANLGGSSFQNCINITSVILPEGITEISGSTFKNCTNLKSIKLPSTINKFNGNAFEGCSSLANVEFTYDFVKYPEFGSNFKTIGNGSVFRGCKSLTSIVFPNSLVHVDNGTFSECTNLTNIVFGESFSTTNQCLAIPKTIPQLILPESYCTNAMLFAWDKDKFTCPTSLVIYYTGDLAKAEVLQATNTYCWEVSHSTLISYDEFTSDSFVRDNSVHYMVYGYNRCDAFYSSVHNIQTEEGNNCCGICSRCNEKQMLPEKDQKHVSTWIFNGGKAVSFMDEITAEYKCKWCEEAEITETIAVIFASNGISYIEDKNEIAKNGPGVFEQIKVDKDALARYAELSGKEFDYGIFALAAGESQTSAPITKGENGKGVAVDQNTVFASFTGTEYTYLRIKITGIPNGGSIFCGAYLVIGDDIVYVSNKQEGKEVNKYTMVTEQA